MASEDPLQSELTDLYWWSVSLQSLIRMWLQVASRVSALDGDSKPLLVRISVHSNLYPHPLQSRILVTLTTDVDLQAQSCPHYYIPLQNNIAYIQVTFHNLGYPYFHACMCFMLLKWHKLQKADRMS